MVTFRVALRPPLIALLASATLIASGCTLQRPAKFTAYDLGSSNTAAGPSIGPSPSGMAAELQAAGLDLAHLPALEDIPDEQIGDVMKIISRSLGATCKDCHTADKTEETPNKRVARKMWSEFVLKLSLPDGSPIFCDSCHQGKTTFLARDDEKALGGWMKTNYVAGLVRKDGAKHGCTTCHGNPFIGGFLDDWSGEGASSEDGGVIVVATEDAGVDAGVADLPTLPATTSCQVVVNEVQVAGSAGATDEFVELFNPCATATTLDGYSVVYRSATGTAETVLFKFAVRNLAAGAYLVLGNTGYSGTANLTYTASLAGTGGGVALRDTAGTLIDRLAYGPATNIFVEGSPAAAPKSGKSIARTPNGSHAHHDQSLDFVVATPSPGAAN